MAILKTRPKVRVRVPSEIRPGDEIRAKVVLDCRRPVEIQGVHLRLEGEEAWTVGSGDSSTTRRRIFLALGTQLSEARELPRGRTELDVRIPIPNGAPPTYRGAAARIQYTLEVHVPIAWWPDRRASFDVFVAPAPVDRLPDEPQVWSSRPGGPRANEPHCEISAASSWTRSGDVVSGAIALSNVAHNRYSEVKVGLRGVETLYEPDGRKRTEREYLRYRIRLGAEEAGEGEMLPFRFRLPPDAMPELPWTQRPDGSRGLCALAWELEVVVGVRWGTDLTLRMPYRVLPMSPRPGDAPSRLAPPTVGSDRLREMWAGIGAEHGLRYEAQTLFGTIGGTTLAIRRDLMGRGGTYLIAELTYDELHLDLQVEPATKMQKVVGGGVTIGDRDWDRDHYVRARDEEQAAEVLRRVIPATANASLRRLDDERFTIEVRDAGVSPTRMERFVDAATTMARAFEAVRSDLPPPTVMKASVESWRALATKLEGELEVARMRIEGRLGQLGAEVRLAFDERGQPMSTWLALIPPSSLDADHALSVDAHGDAIGAIEGQFEGEVCELVKTIAAGATELAIEPERVAVCLPGLLGLPAGHDALEGPRALPRISASDEDDSEPLTVARVEQRLGRLARLVRMLRGQAGPYR